MERTSDLDRQHLRVLSILHYVLGGLVILFSVLPLFFMGIGIFFLVGMPSLPPPPSNGAPSPPEIFSFVGWMYTLLGATTALALWLMAALSVLTGRYLARSQHWKFCIVAAGICCLFVPIGTVLGIFTILVLLRPSVQALFDTGSHKAMSSSL